MTRRLCLVVLASLAYSSSCYSDITFGSSTVTAQQWVMSNVLPQQAGLEVSSVIYRYTTEKDPLADMLVHVQNENALGEGYIFRSTDDWSGLPGNTLNKVVPVANIPIQYWGNGEIAVEGEGSVSDPTIIYNYQFDPCFDPQSNPTCPGYINYIEVEQQAYADPLDDPYIQQELEKKTKLSDEEQKEKDRRKAAEQKKKERLEVALGAINSALMTAQATQQAEKLLAMNVHVATYQTTMPGGKYDETTVYVSKQLQDNKDGLRVGLAQQLLHQEMVDSQYNQPVE